MNGLGVGVGTVIAVLAAWQPASACPHCNVHMYLSEGVRSSENILLVRVVDADKEAASKGEVVRVLCGEKKHGEVVVLDRIDCWGMRVGDQVILLDGSECNGFRMFRAAPEKFRAQMSERLVRGVRDADNLAVADAAYVLCEADPRNMKELPSALRKRSPVRDYAALGVHWAANVRASWWDKDPAVTLHKLSAATAEDTRLRAYVEKNQWKTPF